MARMKFLVDAERCIECNGCVTACKNENEVPWGVNRRRVVTVNDGVIGAEKSISVACMHCSDAPCMAVCPVDCFYRTDDGVVLHDKGPGRFHVIKIQREPPAQDIQGGWRAVGRQLDAVQVAGHPRRSLLESHSDQFHVIVSFHQRAGGPRPGIDAKNRNLLLAQPVAKALQPGVSLRRLEGALGRLARICLERRDVFPDGIDRTSKASIAVKRVSQHHHQIVQLQDRTSRGDAHRASLGIRPPVAGRPRDHDIARLGIEQQIFDLLQSRQMCHRLVGPASQRPLHLHMLLKTRQRNLTQRRLPRHLAIAAG